jgi:RimJ/RimL family protein N-acetyltransferase
MLLPTPTLHTARLLLRPFTEADTDAIFAPGSNPRVLRYWDAPPWHEYAQAERFIARCGQMAQEGSGARLAIEPCTVRGRYTQRRIGSGAAQARFLARRHTARKLHCQWGSVGFLGLWAA